jgi:2,3-bisphosphoglycerate-independent phosphoglycerate mutase
LGFLGDFRLYSLKDNSASSLREDIIVPIVRSLFLFRFSYSIFASLNYLAQKAVFICRATRPYLFGCKKGRILLLYYKAKRKTNMKYVIILSDGMADYPIEKLGGKTPLEAANTPNFDALAASGEVGLCQSVPKDMQPGSDVANLSMLGYDPRKYYTGRSPIEAVSLGVKLNDSDTAMRCNLVTLSGEADFSEKRMLDYSAGEISSAEAKELITAVDNALGGEGVKFYNGVSYRHCLVVNGETEVSFTPPHNISGQKIRDYLPRGKDGQRYIDLIRASEEILAAHPVNAARAKAGKAPATHIWLWGQGKSPSLPGFYEKFNLKGGIISAVDLLKGIAKLSGMRAINVEGATGTLSTNFEGKAQACLDGLKEGLDFIYVHLEAPDECGHQKDLEGKIKAIEKADMVTGLVWDGLKSMGQEYTLCVTADHPTPLSIGSHTGEPVPFVIYRSDNKRDSGIRFSEKEAPNGIFMQSGMDLINYLLKGE